MRCPEGDTCTAGCFCPVGLERFGDICLPPDMCPDISPGMLLYSELPSPSPLYLEIYMYICTCTCICWMVMRLKSLTAAVTTPCICMYTFAKAKPCAGRTTSAHKMRADAKPARARLPKRKRTISNQLPGS